MAKTSERVLEKMRKAGFISPNEASERTAFHPSTIRHWAKAAPKGAYVYHGGLMFVSESWLKTKMADVCGTEAA